MPVDSNSPFDANGMPITRDDAGNASPVIPNKDAPKYNNHTPKFSSGEIGDPVELRAFLIKSGLDPAAVDEAMRGSGHDPKPALPPETAATYRAAGISEQPRPELYHPDLSNNAAGADASTPQGIERLKAMQRATTEVAANLQFEPSVGTSFINRIVTAGRETAAMSKEDLQTWRQRSEQIGIKIAGSKANYADMINLAKAFLLNNAGPAKEFAVALADSAVFSDPQIVSLLATQSGIVAELQRVKARGK